MWHSHRSSTGQGEATSRQVAQGLGVDAAVYEVREPRAADRSQEAHRWEGAFVDRADGAFGGKRPVREVRARVSDRALRGECRGGVL